MRTHLVIHSYYNPCRREREMRPSKKTLIRFVFIVSFYCHFHMCAARACHFSFAAICFFHLFLFRFVDFFRISFYFTVHLLFLEWLVQRHCEKESDKKDIHNRYCACMCTHRGLTNLISLFYRHSMSAKCEIKCVCTLFGCHCRRLYNVRLF